MCGRGRKDGGAIAMVKKSGSTSSAGPFPRDSAAMVGAMPAASRNGTARTVTASERRVPSCGCASGISANGAVEGL